MAAMTEASEQLAQVIDLRIAELEGEAMRLQGELYTLTNDRALALDTVDGRIKPTAANLGRVATLDRAFNTFEKSMRSLMERFAGWLLGVAAEVEEVYTLGGFKVGDVQVLTRAIEARIGITGNTLTPGGYLDRLAKADSVKQQVKDFMLRGIAGKMPLADLSKGLRGLVVGNPGVDGAMVRYLRQYAYDTFNEVRELQNKGIADRLKLRHFVYAGSLIKESRAFCRKRAGKVFTTDEVKTWKNDPTLIEPRTRDSYNPLVERGRYNCRHWIDYISEEMYLILKEKQNAG